MARQRNAFYLDRKGIVHRVREGSRQALNKAGAFIRTRARSSIRPGGKKGRVSQPGEPPRSHVGTLKRGILYGIDERGFQLSTVIGPLKEDAQSGRPVIGTVPRVLEQGGDVELTELFHKARVWGDLRGTAAAENIGYWQIVSRRKKLPPNARTRKRTIHIEPRPFMGPALKQEQSTLVNLWAKSVAA